MIDSTTETEATETEESYAEIIARVAREWAEEVMAEHNGDIGSIKAAAESFEADREADSTWWEGYHFDVLEDALDDAGYECDLDDKESCANAMVDIFVAEAAKLVDVDAAIVAAKECGIMAAEAADDPHEANDEWDTDLQEGDIDAVLEAAKVRRWRDLGDHGADIQRAFEEAYAERIEELRKETPVGRQETEEWCHTQLGMAGVKAGEDVDTVLATLVEARATLCESAPLLHEAAARRYVAWWVTEGAGKQS